MVAAAVLGLHFLRQEMTRTLLSVVRETMRVWSVEERRPRPTAEGKETAAESTTEMQRSTARLEDELRRANALLERLRGGIERVTETLQVAREPQDLDQFLVESARSAVQARSALLMVVDEKKDEFAVRSICGENAEEWKSTQIHLGEGVPALAIAKRKAILLKNGQPTGSAVEATMGMAARGIAVPLFRGETLYGVLAVHEREDGSPFTAEDLVVVSNLTAFMVFGFDHRETRARLETGLEEVLLLLATAVEERDPYSRGHADRVARYAVEMGRVLRLDENTLKTLRWGALLHDIGKLALPDALLRKEGEYTPEEMEIVRGHPIIAEKMIRRAESLSSAAPMVRGHNERCDGTGYPDGLQGTEIPLTTHILIVANLFDAMTSDRSFRRAMPVEEALERLKSFSGTKFDRRAVKALVSLDEKLLVASSSSETGVVRGQGTASICIRS
jgi:HD-GYP domain-containing protein (c-di-GMP phosphodiesterase class II)